MDIVCIPIRLCMLFLKIGGAKCYLYQDKTKIHSPFKSVGNSCWTCRNDSFSIEDKPERNVFSVWFEGWVVIDIFCVLMFISLCSICVCSFFYYNVFFFFLFSIYLFSCFMPFFFMTMFNQMLFAFCIFLNIYFCHELWRLNWHI